MVSCLKSCDNMKMAKQLKWFLHRAVGHDAMSCISPADGDNADLMSTTFEGNYTSLVPKLMIGGGGHCNYYCKYVPCVRLGR